MTEEAEYVTVNGAAELLGTTRRRVWAMLKEGQLHAVTNPIDRREKLIPRVEVEELARYTKKSAA